MYAKRNNTKDREMIVEVDSSDLDKMMLDHRNGLQLGTLRQMCKQFGVSIKTQGNITVLKSRRDGLQMTVEKLHFCRIRYRVVK